MGSQSQSDSSQLTSLINSFREASDSSEKLEHLKSLTSQVLPGLSVVEVEAKFFSRILPKVYDAVLEVITNIGDIVKSMSDNEENSEVLSTIQTLLQLILSFMECLEHCVGHMTQLSLTDELSMGHLHSLPSVVIQTVRVTFMHCKDSEQVYGDFFHLVSQNLSVLFKRTYQLQKALMELVDKVQLNHDASEQDVEDITEVCHQLLDICILIGDLDTSLLVNTWKVLKRLVTKHKDHIKNHLEVERLICHLCSSIKSKLNHCLQLAPSEKGVNQQQLEQTSGSNGDEVALRKMLKVVRFLVGHLVHLVKEFDGYYDKCFEDIIHLLWTIQSNLPPSLTAPRIIRSAVQGLKSTVLVAVEPLLSVLVNNRSFASVLTRKTFEIEEVHRFAHCCLLASVLNILPEISEDVFTSWVMPTNYPEEEDRYSILEAVFNSLQFCVIELCLPVFMEGVMSNGKPSREVTFYEHVCTRMCSLVASTPASCFPAVERCLIENVLQDDILAALLAIDVWCFMARWSSAELCSGHVVLLTKLMLKLPETEAAYLHLSLLIQRLSCFMGVEHQETLVSSFPPSKAENVAAWCVFPLEEMPENVKKKACRCLVPLCAKVCHSQTTKSESPNDVNQLSRCLCCLRRVYSLCQVESYVPPVNHSATIDLIKKLWSLCHQDEQRKRLDRSSWCQLLDLSSMLLPVIQQDDYAEMLSGLRSLLSNCPSWELREAAAQFLGKCGSKEVPESLESTVLEYISSMFCSLVSDKHWLVHQGAFHSVKAFAEVTPYTHVMGDCVPESLLPSLSDFLNQLPFRHEEFSGDITEHDKEFLKRQAETWTGKNPDPAVLDEKEIPLLPNGGRLRDVTPDKCDEPEPKRLKRNDESSETPGDFLYEETVAAMKNPLSSLLDLRKQFVPSETVVKKIQEIQRLLEDFLKESNE